jgi:hypothetical protein
MPIPCDPILDPACAVIAPAVRSASGTVAGGVLNSVAQAVTEGIRWIVVNTATWWIQLPSPNLAAEPAVTRIQQWLLPVAAAVAIGGVIAAGLRMAITRRGNPLLDLGSGLLTIAAATTIGAAAAALLLRAGDAWSAWVLRTSTGGQFTQRLIQLLDLGGAAAPAVVLIFGVIAIILALAQAVLMLFRQASLIILAGVLPLAAAGSLNPATRPWLRKVTSWMLALICYKPAAAAVYATAFTLAGSGHSATTALTGFAMLALSVFTLPALMKFFTWTTGTIASGGGGGGGQFLSAAAMGAVALGAMRPSGGGGASAAQDQASFLSSRLGPGGSTQGPASGAAAPGPASTTASQAGAGASGRTPAPPRTGPSPTGATPAAGASTTGSHGASSAGAASGPAAAGGPAGAAAAAAAQAAQAAAQAARRAAGAMEPGDQA